MITFKGSPEIFGRLTQLRTMHGFNMYYYRRFNITNRDWDCECSDTTPPNAEAVREHVLHLCPLFADDCREFLTTVSRLHKTLTLLGSNKGLLTMVNFLKSSSALTSNSKPYHPPKMLTIPSEIDIADIPDEEEPD